MAFAYNCELIPLSVEVQNIVVCGYHFCRQGFENIKDDIICHFGQQLVS